MGRFIAGDIEHKLWFGIQPTNAPEQFGAIKEPISFIDYNISMEDFNLNKLNILLDNINNYLNNKQIITLKTPPNSIYALFPTECNDKALELLFADTILGLKIYQKLEEQNNDSISIHFTSEL